MWVFYLLSLPMTVGMVLFTLRYFAGPYVPRYVLFTVGYTWFCSLSIIILVPADIWTSLHEKINHENGGISFFWSWSYWSTFLLTWAVVPLIQGYEDAGDFTLAARLKTSVHVNLIFYLIVGSIGLFGIILLIIMKKNWFGKGGVLGFAMASSNTFGLVTGAFLLGFGLSEIPKNIWRNADWSARQKALSHKIAKMAVKLDDAHQEFSNAIVVAQATSNQMPKRDPLRPYMDVIDDMLVKMFKEDPSFKPQGGRLGENDMDYDTDDKSMAALRRHLRIAREEYYRCKSEYMTFVTEALEVEDIIKNYECRGSTGWKFISTLRPVRSGTFGSLFDTLELIWRCILRKQLEKVLAVVLGCMSAAILLAEATLLPNRVDLFLFSRLIKSVSGEEILVQVSAFIPLMYMCVCTYFSLFKIGMLMFYSFTPSQTSSVSLLMICSMVARYAPPISYNFLNLIRLDGNKNTIFEKRMWNIDVVLPFFGTGFNKLYPLIMVIYTIMVASNFFDRVVSFMGNWKRLRFQSESDDTDGFDPSGVIILQKERSLLEQGHKVGEEVIPLARKFSPVTLDPQYAPPPPPILERARRSGGGGDNSRRAMSTKYGPALRVEHSNRAAAAAEAEGRKTAATSVKVSLLDTSPNSIPPPCTAATTTTAATNLRAKWESMKTGFNNLKANVGERGLLQLKKSSANIIHSSKASTSESLDDIFRRLKRPSPSENEEDDDDGMELGFSTTVSITRR